MVVGRKGRKVKRNESFREMKFKSNEKRAIKTSTRFNVQIKEFFYKIKNQITTKTYLKYRRVSSKKKENQRKSQKASKNGLLGGACT